MNILFICHKFPYPPNKGEKIRAYNIIKYLGKRHKIFLYTLYSEERELAGRRGLEQYCSFVGAYRINKFLSNLRSALYLFSSYPLTFGFFYSSRMKKEIKECISRNSIDIVFASSSSTAQYVFGIKSKKKIMDFIDVDSLKWENYAKAAKFPLKFLYSTEAKRLKAWEDRINRDFDVSIVCTEKERDNLEAISAGGKDKIRVLENAVDPGYFSYREGLFDRKAVIFTGQMDYRPNVDAVIYFYFAILPLIRKGYPDLPFYVVGRNPDPSLKKLCRDSYITGEVEDIRVYMDKASIFVAPFRIAHGVQNKVLEAMAFGLPVVGVRSVLQGLHAQPGKDILIADSPQDFAEKVMELLADRERYDSTARNARKYIEEYHNWERNLKALDLVICGS